MKPVDRRLHENIHTRMLSHDYASFLTNPRLQLFEFFERKFCSISGKALDLGAGSAYASVFLALNHSVEKVFALENSVVATNELMPKNIIHYGVSEKVFPIHGCFSNFLLDDQVDFAFSFGSLHHSDCLLTTFKSLARNMKSGAYLLAQEPAMKNSTSNLEYHKKYECEEVRFGTRIKNGDRNDSFFREAEYISAACFSGFDLVYEGNFTNRNLKAWLRYLSRYWFGSMKGVAKNSLEFLTRDVIRKVWVFKKHDTNIPIAHLWDPLK